MGQAATRWGRLEMPMTADDGTARPRHVGRSIVKNRWIDVIIVRMSLGGFYSHTTVQSRCKNTLCSTNFILIEHLFLYEDSGQARNNPCRINPKCQDGRFGGINYANTDRGFD